jgi:cytochrome c556
MNRRIIELALCAVIFAGAATAVVAQGNAADAIAKRQAIMKGMGASAQAIRTAATASDFATAQAKSAELAVNVKSLAPLFPAGSGADSGAKTRAKPEIWTDSAGFKAALEKASAAADGLVAATASKNADQITAALTAFQGSCGGCHTPFRGPPPAA